MERGEAPPMGLGLKYYLPSTYLDASIDEVTSVEASSYDFRVPLLLVLAPATSNTEVRRRRKYCYQVVWYYLFQQGCLRCMARKARSIAIPQPGSRLLASSGLASRPHFCILLVLG